MTYQLHYETIPEEPEPRASRNDVSITLRDNPRGTFTRNDVLITLRHSLNDVLITLRQNPGVWGQVPLE